MADDNKIVEVSNLANHTVSYNLKELNIVRRFQPFETKKISIGELQALNYQRGGKILLREFLNVKDDDFKKELGIAEDSIEYDYTQDDVDNILLTGSDDVLKDALEFGPQGIVDLIISRAVILKIPSLDKRSIIEEFTGVDINTKIKLKEDEEQAMKQEGLEPKAVQSEKPKTEQKRQRRVSTEK